MSYQNIWENFAKETNALKFAIIGQFVVIGVISLCLIKMSYKPPLVIDRGRSTSVTITGDPSPSVEEVESFVREALSQRFDSTVHPNKTMLPEAELKARTKEQNELAKRKIKQRLIIEKVSFEKPERIIVAADLLLSVEAVRSAFAETFIVSVTRVERTPANPYGLILTSVKKQKDK